MAIAYLSGEMPQGRLGIGGAAIREARDVPPSDAGTLTLVEVDAAFAELAAIAGAGSARRRAEAAEPSVQPRHGRGTGLPRAPALRRAATGRARGRAGRRRRARGGRPGGAVRRAAMLAGELAPVGRRVRRRRGRRRSDAFGLRVLQPVQPMLADAAADVAEALAALGDAALEYKLDGARIQVHKAGDEVVVFYTRALERRHRARARGRRRRCARCPPASLILDGEVIALQARRHAAAVPGRRCAASGAGSTSRRCAPSCR